MIRAIRQSCELQLNIDKITFDGIMKNIYLLEKLMPKSTVRIIDEIIKIVNQPIKLSINYLKILFTLDITSILAIPHKSLQYFMQMYDNNIDPPLVIKLAMLWDCKYNNNFIIFANKCNIWGSQYINANTKNSMIIINKCGLNNMFPKEYTSKSIMILMQYIEKIKPSFARSVIDNVIVYDNLYSKIDYSNMINICKKQPISTNEIKLSENDIKHLKAHEIGELKNKILNNILLLL